MAQPWIHKKQADLLFICSPPFLVAVLVLLFHSQFTVIQQKFSFVTWLFFIVFIDVAHVYASLFKTYFNKTELDKHKKIFTWVPVLSLIVGSLLYLASATFFWIVLAYVAVFHFIRQQYGFMRIYSRNEVKTKKKLLFDKIVIYNATIYPMLFWFLNPNRNFNWFMPNEFLQINNPLISQILFVVYLIVFFAYLVNLIWVYKKSKHFNLPKTLLILGTYLSWYLGIVHYNNELIFTAFNVVSHGVPYIALIYFTQSTQNSGFKSIKIKGFLPFLFVFILLLLAFIEEFIWEVTVWQEHIFISDTWYMPQSLHFIWVPLLALPQITHYVLDGFIWKSKK